MRNSTKQLASKSNKLNTKPNFKSFHARVYVVEITNLVNIRRDLANKYLVLGTDLANICQLNKEFAIHANKYNIAKIWELLEFITLTEDSDNLENKRERSWPCSVFGRSLVNSLFVLIFKKIV